jgi:hypothetical protein
LKQLSLGLDVPDPLPDLPVCPNHQNPKGWKNVAASICGKITCLGAETTENGWEWPPSRKSDASALNPGMLIFELLSLATLA